MRRAAWAAALAAAVSASGAPGSGAPLSPPPADAVASPRLAPPAPAAGCPEGYVPEDGYDASCGFCVPESAAALPATIAWRPCGPGAPEGVDCRQMDEAWDPGRFGPEHISQVAPAWVHGGAVTFAFSRLVGRTIERIVADADGDVHQAIVETAPDRCTLGAYDLRDGRVVWRIYGRDARSGAPTTQGGAVYAAEVGELRPRVLLRRPPADPGDRSFAVSALGLFELDTNGSALRQYDWETGTLLRTLDSSAQGRGHTIAHVWPRDGAVYWDTAVGSSRFALRSWSPGRAAADLVSAGEDWSRGAADLGVDGRTLVWAEGDGRASPGEPFSAVRLIEADAARGGGGAVQKGKELARVSGVGFASSPFVVGCGYAAKLASPGAGATADDAQTLLLFRLRDGRTWSLPHRLPMQFSTPLAITCTELFALAAVPTDGGHVEYTIARIGLEPQKSTTGPGTSELLP